jgi:membrane protein implicated in regulation of membrane protease activity
MDEFLKMDIFFFVTTVAVVVLAFFAAYVLWRLQRVLKNIEHVSEQVAIESDIVRQDIAEMRSDIRHGEGRLKSLFGFLAKTEKRTKKKS